jgi:hypothetical protein
LLAQAWVPQSPSRARSSARPVILGSC